MKIGLKGVFVKTMHFCFLLSKFLFQHQEEGGGPEVVSRPPDRM
jgi:hypothetical protein